MSGIFHKRKPSTSENELDTLTTNLNQQSNENKVLKLKISELKESLAQKKQVFEKIISDHEESEKTLLELKNTNQNLSEKIKEQEKKIKSLREIKFQLATDKDASFPQSNNIREIQDLFDLVGTQNERIIFKDSIDSTWEIIRRNDINYEIPSTEDI